MADAMDVEVLPLAEAMVQWTAPALAAAVRIEERRNPPYAIRDFYRLFEGRMQLCPDGELRRPSQYEGLAGMPDMTPLINAWGALERDFKGKIVQGAFHLRGVRTAPEREKRPSVLESAWAADFKFELLEGRVRFDVNTYVNVVAVRGAALPAEGDGADCLSAAASPQTMPEITAATVRDLSDEEVLLLLEEHTRRVVEYDEYKALDPGITKVSFMPLILRKMRARAEAEEILESLAAEARELERWIQTKAPSHQSPTASAIENALRDEYRRLKPQSKGIIP